MRTLASILFDCNNSLLSSHIVKVPCRYATNLSEKKRLLSEKIFFCSHIHGWTGDAL